MHFSNLSNEDEPREISSSELLETSLDLTENMVIEMSENK